MNTRMSLNWRCRGAVMAAAVMHGLASAAPARVLDDFDAGAQVVGSSIGASFGIPVPGVFTDNRILLLAKDDESSATSIAVGGGHLTWLQTSSRGFGDFGAMYDDRITTSTDMSAYNAFQLTVVAAPAVPGTIDFMMVFNVPGGVLSRRATAPILPSGVVTVPFALLSRSDGLPFDLTQVRGVGLEFRGNQTPVGTYVFDDFMAVTVAVPEPGSAALLMLGLAVVALRSVRRA